MVIEKEYPASPELTGGAETELHSHPSSGGGADVKSGTVSGSSGSVSFNTAFSSIPQVVMTSLGSMQTRDAILRVDSVTVNGFSWTADASQGFVLMPLIRGIMG